ncbi:FlgO family outer membrane protein [Salinimonas chungwhensis]|uniref:FlgO family outer membrane protein n=1 Tax=Salinimonas chungwhensis TaxID=265425 RepID=UPI0003671BB7|nr:FlgO family outer membrane protein [Salinimonas chungwhensis]
MKLHYQALGVMTILLTACTSMDESSKPVPEKTAASEIQGIIDVQDADRQGAPEPADYNGDDTDSFGAVGQPRIYSSVQGAYKGRPLTRHIGDYVKNLTQDLISNMEYVTAKTPIAVTNFALLDSNLQQTNLLGQQMAESFVHELHKFRIPVLDFKATDYIRVTDRGDFLLSRDYLDLNGSLPIEYVLTGTMAKHQGGVMVNARILGIESRAVVASAQLLIPFYVVDALIPSDGAQKPGTQDGVKLTQG